VVLGVVVWLGWVAGALGWVGRWVACWVGVGLVGVLGGAVRLGSPSVGVPAAVPGGAGVSPQPASTTDAVAASAAILIPQ
jgi:hypothetical protein